MSFSSFFVFILLTLLGASRGSFKLPGAIGRDPHCEDGFPGKARLGLAGDLSRVLLILNVLLCATRAHVNDVASRGSFKLLGAVGPRKGPCLPT